VTVLFEWIEAIHIQDVVLIFAVMQEVQSLHLF
jgi:hypothetical protein